MKWRSISGAVIALLMLSGCQSSRPATAEPPTPPPQPALAEPIELDFPASLLVDDGSSRALIADWERGALVAIDTSGERLWGIGSSLGDEQLPEAFSTGGSVIVNDFSGTIRSYDWATGRENWAFDIPGTGDDCHPARGFAAQSTATGKHLGDGDLILLSYLGGESSGNCQTPGNPLVMAVDPRTGNEAWPALTVNEEGRTFGGTAVNIAPDRQYGFISWAEGEDSMLTRVHLSTGRNVTVPLTEARTAGDDSGLDYYDVMPTNDPERLIYVYGSPDPDDPYSASVTRTALLGLPGAVLPESEPGELEAIAAPDGLSLEETVDPVCAAQLIFSAEGAAVCVDTQLFASAVRFQGSTGAPKGWGAEAGTEVRALESLGGFGSPQSEPVDSSHGTLLIVPGFDSSVRALRADTGEAVWSAGQFPGDVAWGGQGAFPELGAVIVADGDSTSLYDADTGEVLGERSTGEFSSLSSDRRFALVASDTRTTMWTVVEK